MFDLLSRRQAARAAGRGPGDPRAGRRGGGVIESVTEPGLRLVTGPTESP